MYVIGVLAICSVLVVASKAAGVSLMCPTCPATTDPAQCTHMHKCAHEESCSVEVRDQDQMRFYLFGCKRTDECHQPQPQAANALVGKKRVAGANHQHNTHAPHVHNPHFHFDKSTLVCSDCCTVNNGHCNKDLCASFMPNATIVSPTTSPTHPPVVSVTAVSTTTQVTAITGTSSTQIGTGTVAPLFTATAVNSPSTTTAAAGDPNCRNHEEDGIACTTLDLFHLCTDTSTFAYVIAHEKCAAHCGFCKPSSQLNTVPVTPPPGGVCANFEQDGFTCAKLDLFGFCTGSSSLEYVLAREKCRKHCGFCTP